MLQGWPYDVYVAEKMSRRSLSSENQTPLSPKPTYRAFPSHTQVSDLGKILGLVNKIYTIDMNVIDLLLGLELRLKERLL